MTRKIRLLFSLMLIINSVEMFGQMQDFEYQRKLTGIKEEWHRVELPNEIFGHIRQDLGDIRIFGISPAQDTLEAPYLMKVASAVSSIEEVKFQLLNKSKNENGHFYTFELKEEQVVNQVELDLDRRDFDWRINLQGSHDQQEWFTLVDNYRILKINNELTQFEFTKVAFSDANYRFYRLLIKTQKEPELTSAKIRRVKQNDGIPVHYPIHQLRISEDSKRKQTIIHVGFEKPVRIHQVNLSISDSFDYYRPIHIEFLKDSFKTEQGWRYNYETLTRATLNSIEANQFKFNSRTVQQLKIVIDNQINQPLSVGSLEALGYSHQLLVRFTRPGTYYLTYGNAGIRTPTYDIERFRNRIPSSLTDLRVGEEEDIQQDLIQVQSPLFLNKTWLWVIILIIVVFLGWSTLRMMMGNKRK